MKERNLFKHFTIIGSGTIINVLLGLLNTPIITRLISPEFYGQYSIFLTYGSLIVGFLYLGFDQGLIRYYYNYESKTYKNELLRKSLSLPVILFIIFALLTFLLPINFNDYLGANISTLLFYVLILLFQRFSMLILRLDYNTKLYAFLDIMQRLIFLFISLGIIFTFSNFTSTPMIIGVLISNLFVVLVGIYKKKEIWNFTTTEVSSSVDYSSLLNYSIPFVFTIGITSIFNSIDKVFIQLFLDSHTLGVFASAQSIINLVQIIQNTFNTVWVPAQMEHYNSKPNDKDFFVRANDLITILMFTLGIAVILFKDIFVYFLGEEYRQAAHYLPTLLFGPIMFTISETTVGGIVFKEKSKYHVIIASVTLIFGVIMNLMFVPTFGGVGAAFSTSLSYILYFYLRTYFSKKFYPINFHIKRITILTVVTLMLAVYASYNSFNMIILIASLAIFILILLMYKDSFIIYWNLIKRQFRHFVNKGE